MYYAVLPLIWQWFLWSNSVSCFTIVLEIEKEVQKIAPEEFFQTGRERPYNVAIALPPPHHECAQIPIFWASSSEIIDMFLGSGLREMKLINEPSDNLPLLHCCIIRDLATPRIVDFLSHQIDISWKGSTAVDLGR